MLKQKKPPAMVRRGASLQISASTKQGGVLGSANENPTKTVDRMQEFI